MSLSLRLATDISGSTDSSGPIHSSSTSPASQDAPSQRTRRSTTRHRVLSALLILALMWLAVGCGSGDGDTTSGEGSTALDAFDLPALDGSGERIRLEDYRGTPVVVNFFASWCRNCERELPAFKEVSESLGDKVAFIGVNTREQGDGLAFVEPFGLVGTWPLARDIGGSDGRGLSEAIGARGLPATAFYTADGEFINATFGELDAEHLTDLIDENLGVS
ncbi:MAG: TlpA family protein disulfide reductase [Actinobacteria bacterium]|nr:TlpA family protein disulfide reductase [Actinomycetota bacterium]MCB9389269.1 TlpA family protein disulfide reductase [Acidimicrobiia bacterium]